MQKRSTITDVAEKAGLSVATVSRFFSDNGYPVSSDAARRIERAALELDYTPNMVGRMLKTSSSRDIGVIIPTVRNPFYPEVLLGIEKTAAARGYQILLCNSLRNSETEYRYMNSLYQKQVRGIILASAENNARYGRMVQKGMHIVNLEGSGTGRFFRGIDFDYSKGGRLVAEHLFRLGHKKVAFVTSPLTKKSRRDVLEGIEKVYGNEVIVVEAKTESEDGTGIYEYEMGRQLASRLLLEASETTAIMSVNDMTAAGVIRCLAERGLDVPGDISVTGFDNIELSSMITPPLTTVDQPGYETGCLAAEILVDMIEENEINEYTIAPRLIERASTGRAGGKDEF